MGVRRRLPSGHAVTRPIPAMSGAPLRVAVLGAGTVGHEVACALLERAAELRPADGPALELAAIAVRDVAKAADRGLPANLLTDAPAHLVADDSIDVIVELMGGDEPAHTLIAAALGMGKAVVTANKHVIAHHGSALEAVARRNGAPLRFEAAVGGGIPVLGPLAHDLAGDRVTRVRGIVNGTTNFILTAMTDPDGAARLRDRARRGAAARLCRGRPVGRRRGARRGEQARDPRPAGVRPLAGSGRHRDAAGRPRRPGGPGHHRRLARRRTRGRGRRPDHPPPGDGIRGRGRGDRGRRSCRRRCRSTRRSGGRPACATGSRSTPCPSAASGSTAPAPGEPRRPRPCSAISWRSPAVRVRRGAGSRPRRSRTSRRARPSGEVFEAASGVRYPIDD